MENNFYEWISYLRKKPWAWVAIGIIIMYFVFNIAHGLIVFIGGASLGLYLYNIFEENNPNKHTGIKLMRSSWSTIRNIGDTVIGLDSPKREKFNNYTISNLKSGKFAVGNMLWRSSNYPRTP
jgi:hypothetical protein